MQIQESDEDKPKPAAILNNSDQFAAQIALPEGHQITIGELDPGTLVEIATWHGTGRPDESANRFLLSAEGIGLTRRQSDRSQVRSVPRPTPRPEVRFNEQQAGKQSYLPPQSSNSGLSDLTGFHLPLHPHLMPVMLDVILNLELCGIKLHLLLRDLPV